MQVFVCHGYLDQVKIVECVSVGRIIKTFFKGPNYSLHLGDWSKEDQEFEASLCYTMRSDLKVTKKEKG